MIRSSSTEPAKPKRKSNRRAYILTPARLARKRANDREAQRAIRTRTKEHIEWLQRELAELKSKQSRDQTVRELLRRNTAIEKEIIRLKETMGTPMTSSSYSALGLPPRQLPFPDKFSTSTAFDRNIGTGSDAIPSRRRSPFSGNYNCLHDYSQRCIPLSNNCEPLTPTVSYPILSNISAPSSSSSSSANYSASYIPTNVPTPVPPFNSTSSSSIYAVYDKDVTKVEYREVGQHGTIPQELVLPGLRHGEEVNHTQYLDAGFRLSNTLLYPGTSYSHTYMLHY